MIENALLLESLPDMKNRLALVENLCHFENISDLIQKNKFSKLYDTSLHVIMGIKQFDLIIFYKIHKPLKSNEPFVGLNCKIGISAFGVDKFIGDSSVKNGEILRLPNVNKKKFVY